MDGERRGDDRDVRESAPFDVSVEDYRRAFALALATWPEPPPPSWRERLAGAKGYALMVLAIAMLWGCAWAAHAFMAYPEAFGDLRSPYFRAVMWQVTKIMAFMVLAMAPVGVLTSLVLNWDARGWRRRFPRERAAWKRPGRMRIRWSEAGLVLAWQEGFGSFGWNQLHAWLNAPDELVIFTGIHDPVPVPHAALGTAGLDDLRHRLFAAEVPQAWRPMSGEELGLKRVFD